MDVKKTILGRKALVVDDEKDVLDVLTELLELCKIDTATSFEEAKGLLDLHDYDIAILDIMGVKGFELLEIANQKGVPVLMLTAHALSEENLRKSAENGAAYFVPKDKIHDIATYVADVLDAKAKKKNPWVRWFERLGGTFDNLFTGRNWREREKEFWERVKARDWPQDLF